MSTALRWLAIELKQVSYTLIQLQQHVKTITSHVTEEELKGKQQGDTSEELEKANARADRMTDKVKRLEAEIEQFKNSVIKEKSAKEQLSEQLAKVTENKNKLENSLSQTTAGSRKLQKDKQDAVQRIETLQQTIVDNKQRLLEMQQRATEAETMADKKLQEEMAKKKSGFVLETKTEFEEEIKRLRQELQKAHEVNKELA
jgi:chromosome segregation ATPase